MAVEIAPHIVFDPSIPLNKPVIEGTRVPVEEVIAKLATGMTVEALAESYQIKVADVQAALKYAAKKVGTEELDTLLEESVRAGNYQQFVSLAEAIDWTTRRPEELTKAIDLALSVEMTRLAVKLAELGGGLFPDHDRVQRAAKVLAPPVVRQVYPPRAKGLDASMAWFDDHADQYRGLWVAVREGELLGTAQSLAELNPVIGQGEDRLSTIVTKVL